LSKFFNDRDCQLDLKSRHSRPRFTGSTGQIGQALAKADNLSTPQF
jgi:hypothetical protein